MIRFFVKHPITTIMSVMFFVVLGIVSYFNLSIESDPKVEFPIVTVKVVYPGATPVEVETQVVNKIEDVVSEISEIKKIRSDSYENFGYIFVEFFLGTDVNIKSIEVKDKVEATLNDLPDDIEKPIIEKYDPLIEPVMDLVLWGDGYNGRDLYEYADKVLATKISSIEGVAKVDIHGGKERQINVTVDPSLMKKYYVTIYDVVSKIAAKNSNIPSGLLEREQTSTSVRFLGEFEDVEDISEMIMTSQDGVNLKISDIAEVEDGYKKIDSIARYNKKEVVSLSVKKVSDGNAVDIARSIRKKLQTFNDILPDGMHLEIANDTTEIIIEETNGTLWNILIGILFTIVILYLFTGRFSITFIASIVIPASIISTMFLVDTSGFTINSMTLLAVATCLGTLIANAIVIIENVLKHLEKGDDPQEAAISGTQEVAVAVFAATGTNLVVFTPIAFMGGMVGQFMNAFGLTVVYATLFSLFSSFTLTPMLCGILIRKKDRNETPRKDIFYPFHIAAKMVDTAVEFLKKEYKIIFDAVFRHTKVTLLVMILLFWSLKFIMPFIDNEFFPSYDEDIIAITVEMSQGSTIDKTLAAVEKIEERIAKVPEIESFLTKIGENGVENGMISIDLMPSGERDRTDEDIINELLPFMTAIPDTEIVMSRSIKGGSADVSINVNGLEYDKIVSLSERMKGILESTGYFRTVTSSYKKPKKEIEFIPDQEKLIRYGINNSLIGYMLRASIYGDDSNTYKEEGEEYKINVEADRDYAENLEDISQICVISKKGMIPITELGELIYDKAVPSIKHRDKDRVISLEGTLAKGALGGVRETIDREFSKLNIPEGYGYTFVGLSEHQDESGREISKAFLLAVILTFMLLSAIMNSMTRPIPIIISIATSFIGVFVMFFFSGQSINIASMLGMVMLVGLVVNNSILMLDFVILKIDEGVELKEAIWLGASEKFKAILMTSIAIILGVVPQMFSLSPLKTSMGAVIVGGMTASILFTFIFTPVLFWYIERFDRFVFHRKDKT